MMGASRSGCRTVVVTGGAGYIGSHCCKALSESGFVPVCVDNLSTGHAHFVRWGPFERTDIRNTTAVARVIEAHQAIAVIHFAAYSSVGESVSNPSKYYDNNVGGTLSLIQAMSMAGCKNLIMSSTGAVYGIVDKREIAETTLCSPINPYGASKWMAERILDDERSASGLRSFCLRYFNASGADPSGMIGELRENETHLIPRAMLSLLDERNKFSVYGNDYETPDGTAVRDYIHVNDLASAHVRALRLLLDGHIGASLNLGTSKGFSVKQILSAIERETGRRVPHSVHQRRSGDPAILVANAEAARTQLGFVPRSSELSNIVATAWAWHAKHFAAAHA